MYILEVYPDGACVNDAEPSDRAAPGYRLASRGGGDRARRKLGASLYTPAQVDIVDGAANTRARLGLDGVGAMARSGVSLRWRRDVF